MFIRSKRLFLRPGWPEDWTEILTAINDYAVVCNLARAPWPYAMEDAIAFARRPQEWMLPHFLITLPSRSGAKLVGSVGLARDGNRVEIGYWIARQHWGHGFATEAVRAVLQLAQALGHQFVRARHFVDYPASGRVLEKAGFRKVEKVDRFSLARGGNSPAFDYEVELGALSDCELGGCMPAA